MEQLLFVYGTLRKHCSNSHFLSHAALVKNEAWIVGGQMYDTDLGYPVMSLTPSSSKVYGELYRIRKNEFEAIDQLEEGYERTVNTVYTDAGVEKAWVYTVDDSKCLEFTKIESGNWKEYLMAKEKPDDIYYFAYGSCMDEDRFKKAKVDHLFLNVIGGAILQGYTTRFTVRLPDGGRADIVEDDGVTEGVLYKVPQDAVTYLYKREGVFENLYRPAFVDVNVNGRSYHDCLTFIVVDKKKELAPPDHYRAEIERGAERYLTREFFLKIVEHMSNLKVNNI
ncbi:gamma-glutamylcyclotransferase [Bacillus gobiensis]|uniref:gamma-glutamylcyclotransferase n=1 Tax=Bacillus gobiensis TaxID=1441095 RepID=UPI003D2259A3